MMRLKPTCRTSPKLAPKTHAAYKLTLDLFQQSCSKIFVHQVSKQDLQAFDSFLLKQGHEDRTRANRIQHVITFLRNKEGRRAGPPVTDVSIRIKYVEQPPEAYTRQELEDLFRVSECVGRLTSQISSDSCERTFKSLYMIQSTKQPIARVEL